MTTKKSNLKMIMLSLGILLSVLITSCSTNLEDDILLDEEISISENNLDGTSLFKKNLGLGTLDDRSPDYNESKSGSYRVYKIKGGTRDSDGNSVRIERYYSLLKKRKNRKGVFKGTYNISKVSAGGSYIAQMHSSTPGSTKGPVWLLKAYSSGSQIRLVMEDVLFNGGTPSNGGRSEKEIGRVDKDKDFKIKIICGWNSSSKAFYSVYVGDVKKRTKTHSRNDSTMRFRYGAYRANSGKITEVKIKSVSYDFQNGG